MGQNKAEAFFGHKRPCFMLYIVFNFQKTLAALLAQLGAAHQRYEARRIIIALFKSVCQVLFQSFFNLP